MEIRRHARAVAKDFGIVLSTAGAAFAGAFTYLPRWDPGEEAARYVHSTLAAATVLALGLAVALIRARVAAARDAKFADASSALTAAREVGRGIASSLVRIQSAPGSPELYAACHNLGKPGPPSAFSSAYALRALLASPGIEAAAPLNPIFDYVMSRRLETGWHASSQSSPSVAVTAAILSTIRAFEGETANSSGATDGLLQQIEEDDSSINTTFVAALALAGMPNLPRLSPLRVRLERAIINGFVTHGEGGHWCSTLTEERHSGASASTAATAHCILALRAHPDIAGHEPVQKICRQALHWLATISTFSNEDAPVVRDVSGRQDVLVHRHFSAALVVLAACACAEMEATRARAIAQVALRNMMEMRRGRYWSWNDGSNPVWMNAQAIEAVTTCAATFGF